METEGTAGESGAATDVGAGLAPAQTNEPAQNTQTGAHAQTAGKATQAAQPAQTGQYNFDEIHAKAEAGEDIPDEFYDQYEKDLLSGKQPSSRDKASLVSNPDEQSQPDTSQEQANADGGKEQAQELQAAMAKVGAKTPQEVPVKIDELRNAFSQASERAKFNERECKGLIALMHDMAAGKQEAFDHFKKVTGKDFPTQPGAQQPAQAAPEASPFSFSEEEIATAVDDNLWRKVDKMLQAREASYQKEVQSLNERVKQYEDYLAAEQDKASLAKYESSVMDTLMSIAEMEEFENLKALPVRNMIAEHLKNPDRPLPKELEDLIEVAELFADKKAGRSLQDACKIHFYDRTKGKIAQAKIEAAKGAAGAQAKPTVGIHGTTQSGSSAAAKISDAVAEQMAAGDMDIPDEYLDDDGIPTAKMPENLRALLFRAA